MNTKQWLDKVLSSKEELVHWLKRQYIGEVTAAKRIKLLLKQYPESNQHKDAVTRIAQDESKHATWIKGLLQSRGIPIPKIANAEKRYWKPILSKGMSWDDITAAGHHAEGMRLVRIKALANDERVDTDIRQVFANILPDETFHEKAFASFSTKGSINKMKVNHQQGLVALGLTM